MSQSNETSTEKNFPGPARLAMKVGTSAHAGVYRATGGKLGGRMRKSPILLLNTVGRKTGRPRVNPLFSLADGPDLVVIASNGGADSDPAWWLNLQAQPNAEVEVGGVRRPVRAREATVDEAGRLWPRIVAANPDYADYRRTARRPIPIVILEAR